MEKNSVAIIGMGNVGQAICHSLLKDGIFQTIYIIDKDPQLVEGLYLDFSHAAVNYGLTGVKPGTYQNLKECSFVIITIGVKQNSKDSREKQNKDVLNMYDEVLNNMAKVKYNEFVIIASNPLDLLTYYTYKKLGIDKNKIIGTGTLLDSKRFKFLLAERLKVSPNALQGFVLGQHGRYLVPIYSITRVYSAKLSDYMFNHNVSIDKEKVNELVREGGYYIVGKVGATRYGISESVSEIIQAITLNKGALLPVSIISEDGTYAMSLPTIVTSEGVEEFKELYFTKEEIATLEDCRKDAKAQIEFYIK